jgi:hypothetical protein
VIFDAAMDGAMIILQTMTLSLKKCLDCTLRMKVRGHQSQDILILEASGSLIELYYHTGSEDTIAKVFNLTFGQNFGDPSLSYNFFLMITPTLSLTST